MLSLACNVYDYYHQHLPRNVVTLWNLAITYVTIIYTSSSHQHAMSHNKYCLQIKRFWCWMHSFALNHEHNRLYAYPMIMVCICPCFTSWWSCNGIYNSQAWPTLPWYADPFMRAHSMIRSSGAYPYILVISYPCRYPPISIHPPLSLYIQGTSYIHHVQFSTSRMHKAWDLTQFEPDLD